MKQCPFCAEEIQDAAIVCKHCGHELTAAVKSSTMTAADKQKAQGCLVALGVLVALIVIAFATQPKDTPPPPPTPADTAMVRKRADLVSDLQAKGLIASYDCERMRAQVSPIHWLVIDADSKVVGSFDFSG